MAISIKNHRADDLARELSRESGENLTQAIIHALEERLARLRGRRIVTDIAQELREISERCRALPDFDDRRPDEILGYDRKGIPE